MQITIISNTTPIDAAAFMLPVTKSFASGATGGSSVDVASIITKLDEIKGKLNDVIGKLGGVNSNLQGVQTAIVDANTDITNAINALPH